MIGDLGVGVGGGHVGPTVGPTVIGLAPFCWGVGGLGLAPVCSSGGGAVNGVFGCGGRVEVGLCGFGGCFCTGTYFLRNFRLRLFLQLDPLTCTT